MHGWNQRARAVVRITDAFAAVALSMLLSVVGTVLGVAFVLGRVSHRYEARPFSTLATVGGVLLVVVVSGALIRLSVTWVLRHMGWPGFEFPHAALGAASVLLIVLLNVLQEVPLPDENLIAAFVLEDTNPRYDVMLVVDPREPAGRRLVEAARNHPAELLRRRPGAENWNVAFGLAVVADGGVWRRVLQPSPRREAVVAALAGLPESRGSDTRRSYGAALVGLADPVDAGWRRGTRRAVIVVHAGLPSPREFGYQPPSTPAERLFPSLRSAPFGVTVYAARRPALVPRPGDVGLYAAVERAAKGDEFAWSRWLGAAGGRVIRFGRQSPLEAAGDAIAGTSDHRMDDLAIRFRPALLFDSAHHEPYRPLDVDRFLAERRGRTAAHEVCDASFLHVADRCEAVLDGRLPRNADFLRLAAGTQIQRDDDRTAQRIYYNATRDGSRLHLDYWWFYRFNLSPVAPNEMCVAGLGVSDVTCYDHEGDWEGVTVTLRRQDAAGWTPESVVYAGHAWAYSFQWPDLVRAGRTRGDHALVYVAFGSHASYPRPCRAARTVGTLACPQPRLKRPDGARDGGDEWNYNGDDRACRRDACVARLPTTIAGQPALWAAFGGRWGRDYCVIGLKLCVRAAGPRSPYYQARYAAPGRAPKGRVDELR